MMPQELQLQLRRLKIMDSLAWANGSNLYNLMQHVAASHVAAKVVDAFMKDTMVLARGLQALTCRVLMAELPELAACPTFPGACQGGFLSKLELVMVQLQA